MASNKIILKFDSLFNTFADAIVIPRSTVGTISSRIKKDIVNILQIDIPETLEYRPLGVVDITQYTNLNRQNNLKPVFNLLLATCVDNNTSTYESIAIIAREIAEFTKRNPEVRDVAVPLLGTGAGGLDHMRVYQSLATNFTKYASEAAVLEIFVADERIYNLLKRNEDTVSSNDITTSGVFLTEEQKLTMEVILERALKEHDFFLAGALWDSNDLSDDFFKNGVWKNGNHEKFKDLVKNISPGAVILLKSTFAKGDTSFLRIKGIGIVTLNSGDGIELSVNWRIHNIQHDIANMGSYRSTIAKINAQVSGQIIRAIPDWHTIIFALFSPDDPVFTPEIISQSPMLAGLLSDSDEGDDYLDIKNDVDAFAKIMAAESFRPPLAVALFGKWGTGKSFFMKKLKDRISYYAQQDNKVFCNGIAHIHFNAWSYLDANLWASIVSKIFEGLNQYIGEHKKADCEVEVIRIKLMEQLSLNFMEMDRVKKEQTDLNTNIILLTSKKDKLSADLKEKKKTLAKDLFSKALEEVDKELKVKERITDAFAKNSSVTKASKELREIVPEEYLRDPAAVLKRVQSGVTYVKVFFSREKWWSNLLWLTAIVLFVYYAPKSLHWLIIKIKGTDFSLPPVDALIKLLGASIPILHLVKKTYGQVQPLVASLWKIKVEYETAMKDAEANLQKQELEIGAAITSAEQQLVEIEIRLKETEQKQAVLTYKKEHALSTEALYQFIGKRTISEDYQQHLGIVSLIRRDFEALSDLFYNHNEENQHTEFLSNFSRPLQRIILYVDDLDRCREDRVVEVLEAVNLLMAFPLFVVVVGVDPRWVRNALIRRYGTQFAAETSEQIDSSDYLEKIFQVPFHLKAADDQSIRTMIRTLSQAQDVFEFDNDAEIFTDDNPSITGHAADVDNNSITDNFVESPLATNIINKEEQLKLSKWEIDLMEDMSVVLGNNPRAIKRFVNIYQIVRAHAGLTYMAEHEKREFLAIQFLVALYNGCYRKIAPFFVNYMHGYQYESKQLVMFLQEHNKTPEDIVVLKKELFVALSDKLNYHNLLKIDMANFKAHNNFIQRFSFDEILVPSIVDSNA